MCNKSADLNVARDFAACTIFEGKIVVTGGEKYFKHLNSVEACDCYKKRWNFLPDMSIKRFYHAAVSMGVIGERNGTSCEVFDSFSNNFTILQSQTKVPK